MIMSRTPVIEQSAPDEDESIATPVSAGTSFVEGRIADEMAATLQGWLSGLPTRSARHRKGKRRT